MKVYLNNKELNNNYSRLTLPQILNNIKMKSNSHIIKEIYLNGVQINEKYLEQSLINKKDINKINFITQNTENLIQETLREIDSYLPRLKNGCLDVANLFRNGELDKANNKLQLIFDGLNWYINSTHNIVNLLENPDLKNKIKNNLISINKFLKEIYKAQENKDNILIADILEYEIVEFINKFILLNKKIISFFKKESDK